VLLMGRVESLRGACLFYAIVGIGATGMWTPVITVVQRWFARRRRGMALGVLSTGYGLGFAAMGAAFPWIVANFSWRYAWYFLGVAAMVMVLVNSLLLRSSPESAGFQPWGENKDSADRAAEERSTRIRFAFREVFRNRIFWLVGMSYLCISYSLYGITTFMVDYARYQLGLPIHKAGLLATIHGICQVAGVLTILPLSDLVGRRNCIALSNAAIALCLAGILASGTSWLWLALLVGMLAVFYGATFPMYGACAGEYFPKEVMGTVIGAWTPFYGSGAILVHWVSGILRDSRGDYDLAFLLNALMAASGLGLILAIRK
jgi:sugar phosphate permease